MLRFCQILGFLFVSVHLITAAILDIQDCGNDEIKEIRFEPCPKFPCHFERGESANLTVVFAPEINSDGVHAKFYLRTGGYFDYIIAVEDFDPMLCKGTDKRAHSRNSAKLDCPLVANKSYSFVLKRSFPVSTRFNYFKFVKIQIFNKNNEMIGCAESPIQLQRLLMESNQPDKYMKNREIFIVDSNKL